MPASSQTSPGFLLRLARGLPPSALVLGMVYATGGHARRSPLLAVGVLIVCAAVLWLGRRWMKGTLITKWIGLSLAAYLILTPALGAFSATVTPLPFFFLIGPLAIWDLFIAQPWKGRFARARAERRGIPE